MAEWLVNNSKGAHMATCNDDRKGCPVVKGIHSEYSTEYVEATLSELVDNVVKARRFQEQPNEHGSRRPWWIVTTKDRETLIKLRQFKTFGSLETPIKWEPQKSSRVLRCFRCNGYRHVAKNCMYKENCALCASNHSTRDCKVVYPSSEVSNFGAYKCVNCQKGGHWARAKNCPAYMKEVELVKKVERENTKEYNSTRQQIPQWKDFVVNEKTAKKIGVPVPQKKVQTTNWNAEAIKRNSDENKCVMFMQGMRRLFDELFK